MKFSLLKNNFGKELQGPLVISPEINRDKRGFFLESWNQYEFDKVINEKTTFVQDNHSKSKKEVLRGMHYQLFPNSQGKLIRCIVGNIFDVIVDIRKSSNTFLSWAGIKLDSKSKNQLWIPSGFAHGFLTLTNQAEIIYKTTCFWSKESERALHWNDPYLKIKWPLNNKTPLLSEKDQKAPNIKNISNNEFFP